MNFEIKNIDEKKRGSKTQITVSISIVISLLIIVFLSLGIFKAVEEINFSIFLKLAGASLEKDSFGHTNFILLGTGGEGHDGGDLTDSIIIASLDEKTGLVTMLSLPRDFYIQDKKIGSSRINEIYFNAKAYFNGDSEKGLEYMKEKVEETIGLPIHYWFKIDFKGFKELIDVIGGIDIEVHEAIYDPYYPKDETHLYEPFTLAAGQQHLNGETALKYARSRKTTSDFDRSDRQQKVLQAIKDKALQTNIIFSKDKIQNIFNVLSENIETNISIKEILTLGGVAADITPEKITHRLIHDDPSRCGGFLYTPERALYGGAFVLIPAGGTKDLLRYTDLNFNYPEASHINESIQILNGTKSGGTAGETKTILSRYCFNVARYGNARNQKITETTYFYRPVNGAKPSLISILQKMIPGKESTEIPSEYAEYTSDIILEIGSDYTESKNYIKDPYYYLPVVIAPTENQTETTADETIDPVE